MFRDALRGLLGRARRASAPASVGIGFQPPMDADFAALDPALAASFRRVDAALREAWAAGAGAAPGDAAAPLFDAFAAAERKLRAAAKAGVAAGMKSGQLGHATAPLAAAARDFAQRLPAVVVGVYVVHPPLPRGLGAWLAGLGPGATAAADGLQAALARVPLAPALGPALLAAMSAYEADLLASLAPAAREPGAPGAKPG